MAMAESDSAVEQQFAQHAATADSRAGRSAHMRVSRCWRSEASRATRSTTAGLGQVACDTIENVGCGRLSARSGRAHGNRRLSVQPSQNLLDARHPFRVLRLECLQHEEASGHGKLVAAGRVGAHDETGRCAEQLRSRSDTARPSGCQSKGGEKFQASWSES